jgi:O-antigen/teichoic acid export membrane protein
MTVATTAAPKFSLRKNFSWMLVGNVIYAASQWGILVLLAKLGTPEMVGQFALGLAVTAPIIMFANLQLRAVQVTDARREYAFTDYFGLRLVTTSLAYVVIVVVTLLSGYEGITAAVILLIGLSKSFEAVSDIFFGLLQQYERMDRIGKSVMIEGPVTLLVMALLMFLTQNVVVAVAGLAIVWGLQLIFYDFYSGVLIFRAIGGAVRRELTPHFNKERLRKLIRSSLPLGFAALLISLNATVPRYFISTYLGNEQLGIFAASAYIMTAEMVLVNTLAQAAVPRLAEYFAAGNPKAFYRLLFRLLGFGAAVGGVGVIIAVVIGKEILTLLYQPQYATDSSVFVILMLATLVANIASFLNFGMVAVRAFDAQIPLFVVVALTSVGSSIYFIPAYGLKGAGFGLIATFLVQILGASVIIVRAFNKPLPKTDIKLD